MPGGPQHMLDARQILKVRQPSSVEADKISLLATQLGVIEEWNVLSAGQWT